MFIGSSYLLVDVLA